MTPIREHIRCGLHSGIPACCIAWYLTGWRALGLLDRALGKSERFDDGTELQLSGTTVAYLEAFGGERGYVPCPVCVAVGRRVEVRRCDCEVDARMRREVIELSAEEWARLEELEETTGPSDALRRYL